MSAYTTFSGDQYVTHQDTMLVAHTNLVQADDFIAALKSTYEMDRQEVGHKQPRVLIERMKIVGTDELTATDAAVYELLLANAKEAGIDRAQHSIEISALSKFVAVPHIDRILGSLERITRTVVRYDIIDDSHRIRGSVPLIIAQIKEELSTSTSILTYQIPEAIRTAILASSQYAVVDLAPMAQFKGRYTPRLFQRLSIRAGYDEGFTRDWTITPQELAEELGYAEPEKTSRFMERVVLPAVKEINESKARFSVTLTEPARLEGRGRKFGPMTFAVTGMRKRGEQIQKPMLDFETRQLITAADHFHAAKELPSLHAVSVAAGRTGIDPKLLANGWRKALDVAKIYSDSIIYGEMTGAMLLDEVEFGTDNAFLDWVASIARAADIDAGRQYHAINRQPFSAVQIAAVSSNDPDMERRRRWMVLQNAAARAHEMLDGFMPGSTAPKTYTDEEVISWLDPKSELFAGLADEMTTQFVFLKMALSKARHLEGWELRTRLRDLAAAIQAADADAVRKLVRKGETDNAKVHMALLDQAGKPAKVFMPPVYKSRAERMGFSK